MSGTTAHSRSERRLGSRYAVEECPPKYFGEH